MQQQTMAWQDLYRALYIALSRSLSDSGCQSVAAALEGQPASVVAAAFRALTDAEALAVFHWLDDERAIRVLEASDAKRVNYLFDHTPAARILRLLGGNAVADASPEDGGTARSAFWPAPLALGRRAAARQGGPAAADSRRSRRSMPLTRRCRRIAAAHPPV